MPGHGTVEALTEIHLRTAIEQSPLGTIIVDPDGRCLMVNAAWNDLWDLGEDESLVTPTSSSTTRCAPWGSYPT